MLLKKEIKYPDGTIQTGFYISKCKYCGREYIKKENRQTLCSTNCKHKSTQDNKAAYQRKRRRLINQGIIISQETEKIGTVYFPEKIGDWDEEIILIKKIKRRTGIT